jgi:hypothetical protein
MSGWIKLHRQVRDHWIWCDPVKLKWWLDIIMDVNHSMAKVNIGFNLVECGRGQSVRSLQGWADRWNISKDSARHFLMLLAKDKMIVLESLKFTTRITVCNYDIYNEPTHSKQTEGKHEPNGGQTQPDPNKKDNNKKNDIKDREFIFKEEVESFAHKYDIDMLTNFFIHWSEPNPQKTKMKKEMQKTWDTSRRLAEWKSRGELWKKR